MKQADEGAPHESTDPHRLFFPWVGERDGNTFRRGDGYCIIIIITVESVQFSRPGMGALGVGALRSVR
jgi:hypothetical protein